MQRQVANHKWEGREKAALETNKTDWGSNLSTLNKKVSPLELLGWWQLELDCLDKHCVSYPLRALVSPFVKWEVRQMTSMNLPVLIIGTHPIITWNESLTRIRLNQSYIEASPAHTTSCWVIPTLCQSPHPPGSITKPHHQNIHLSSQEGRWLLGH